MSVARPIPVFRPTPEEFSDFSKYVTSIEPIAEQFGICKIIPPEGWRPRVSSYDDIDIEIPCPIRQFVHGKQGVYQVVNVMEKPMTLSQFKQAANEQFAKCFPKSKREGSDAEKFDIEELERRFWKNLTFHAPLYGADMLGTLFEEEEEEEGEEGEENAEEERIEVVDDHPPAKSKKNNSSPKRKRSDDEAGTGDEGDKKKRNAWNLGHLDTLLSQRLGKLLPGVTSPYLYFGMWKSLFACHTEDMDLYSINFLHFGKPKVWYGVPSAQKHRVDQVARLHFPMQFKECSEFLRHKSAMFSPGILKTGNVSLTHAVQQPGEFIITFPGAYHFGFNAGFNCAEAVNFALERWLDFGKKAKPCKCVADSVRIDVGMFISMVATGQEMTDVLPTPAKKAKAEPKKKPKARIAKRKSRATGATKAARTTAPTVTTVGGRSMGMVTGRMMAAPQPASALIPEPPLFMEETLGDDEDLPLFSDDELRSGDENDGGEYREGSKARRKDQAKKPRRSKRMENKRNGVSASANAVADESAEAPASSKADARAREPAPEWRKKRTRTVPQTSTPAGVAGQGTEGPLPNNVETTTTATETAAPSSSSSSPPPSSEVAQPKPQKKKRVVKRKNAKVESHFQKKVVRSREQRRQRPEEPAREQVASVHQPAVSTREYQGLKIIIRPPRANSNVGDSASKSSSGARKQRTGERRGRSKDGGGGQIGRKGKKAHPDLMPEGKTTAWHQLNAEANHQLNRDSDDGGGGDIRTMKGPTVTAAMNGSGEYSAGQTVLAQAPAATSARFVPERQYSPPSYGHFLVGERTQRDSHHATEWIDERPQPVHVDYQGQGSADLRYGPTQSFPPTLRDYLSTPASTYPQMPVAQGQSFASGSAMMMGGGGQHDHSASAYSLALEMHRRKLKELREKRQQLQQQRLEQQPHLQQLQQFIQAQRQLQQQPQTTVLAQGWDPTPQPSPYGSAAGRYASGLPPPLPTLSMTSTSSSSVPSMPAFSSSSIAASYGIPLPPSLSSSSSLPSSVAAPSSFSSSYHPPPQRYTFSSSPPPLPPHLYMERERVASNPATALAAEGAVKSKLVPILPSPSSTGGPTAALYAPRSASPSAVPPAAPSSFPVSS